MRSTIKKGFLAIPAVFLLVFGSGVANADPIVGSITFANADWSTDGTTLTVIDPLIVSATGDLVSQTGLVISDLDYNPFQTIDPLWQTDGFSFAITSLVIIFENAGNLILEGTGILTDRSGTLDATAGIWSFTGGNLNWSSSTIPEPATLTLLGLGLMGMGLRRRKVSA